MFEICLNNDFYALKAVRMIRINGREREEKEKWIFFNQEQK